MTEQSPTGTPRMSPRRVPLYLSLAVGAAAAFAAAGQLLPQQYELARVICTVLAAGIGAGLGVASPGLRKQGGTLLVLFTLGLSLQGCATSYKPTVTGPMPFAFTPSPEQCAQLLKEKRAYRATEKTATYVSGATALLSVLFLGLVEEKAVPAVSAGATLLSSGVGVFAGSQVESLEQEIDLGACLTR